MSDNKITLNIKGNNLFTTNLLIQSYNEKLPIHCLKKFKYKTIKENDFVNNFLEENEDNAEVLNIYYLIISRLQIIINYYETLSPKYEDEKNKQNEIFFYTLSSLSILYLSLHEEYSFSLLEDTIPITHNFLYEYADFINFYVNFIDNKEIFKQDDFDLLEGIVFQQINSRFNKLKKSFNKINEIKNEINIFTNIYELIDKNILKKENDIIYDSDTDINFISFYPDFIFIDNLFIYENFSISVLLKQINNNNKILLDKFLLSIFIMSLDEDIKNQFTAIVLKNKLISNEFFSLNNNYDLMGDYKIFLKTFISNFNKKKLQSDYFKTKLNEFAKDIPKSYKNIQELEINFINFIKNISNILAYSAPTKNLKNIDYNEEIKTLTSLILKILKEK